MGLHEFTVAGALVESNAGLLLVQNRRRNGAMEWSTPGGVIDPTDVSLLAGLAREVEEETGLRGRRVGRPPLRGARGRRGPRLVVAMRSAPRRSPSRARSTSTTPTASSWTPRSRARGSGVSLLGACSPWVREPLLDWLDQRWGPREYRAYTYDVFGSRREALRVVRTSPV